MAAERYFPNPYEKHPACVPGDKVEASRPAEVGS